MNEAHDETWVSCKEGKEIVFFHCSQQNLKFLLLYFVHTALTQFLAVASMYISTLSNQTNDASYQGGKHSHEVEIKTKLRFPENAASS